MVFQVNEQKGGVLADLTIGKRRMRQMSRLKKQECLNHFVVSKYYTIQLVFFSLTALFVKIGFDTI